jgi:hypothetical protein
VSIQRVQAHDHAAVAQPPLATSCRRCRSRTATCLSTSTCAAPPVHVLAVTKGRSKAKSFFEKPTLFLLCLCTARSPSPSHAVALLLLTMSSTASSSAPVNRCSSPSRAPTSCPATKNRSHRRQSSAVERLPSIALIDRPLAPPTLLTAWPEHPADRWPVLRPPRPHHRSSTTVPCRPTTHHRGATAVVSLFLSHHQNRAPLHSGLLWVPPPTTLPPAMAGFLPVSHRWGKGGKSPVFPEAGQPTREQLTRQLGQAKANRPNGPEAK